MATFRVIAQNKDTGQRVLCATVSTLAEAKRSEKEYSERFPNDIVWFTRQITAETSNS